MAAKQTSILTVWALAGVSCATGISQVRSPAEPSCATGVAGTAGTVTQPTPLADPRKPLAREDLAAASCGGAEAFEYVIARRDSLSVDLASTIQAERQRELTYWQAATKIGCARVTTAGDGRIRVWVVELETMTDQGVKRGRAYLSWLDSRGRYRWRRDADDLDLHLDTIIDGIFGLDGAKADYLIVGLRAYRTKFPGDRPRRFARTVRIDSDSGEVVSLPSFTAGKNGSVLLLKGPVPETGKFRHHVFAKYWLQYHPNEGLLMLEAIPGSEVGGNPAAVAVWNRGTWEMRQSWASSLIVDHW